MTRMHFIARVSTPRLPPPPLLAVACLSDQHDRSVETLTSVKTMRLRRFSHINCRNIMHLADTSSLWNVNLLFASKTIIFLNLHEYAPPSPSFANYLRSLQCGNIALRASSNLTRGELRVLWSTSSYFSIWRRGAQSTSDYIGCMATN